MQSAAPVVTAGRLTKTPGFRRFRFEARRSVVLMAIGIATAIVPSICSAQRTANPFDQFDAEPSNAQSTANPYDQFDVKPGNLKRDPAASLKNSKNEIKGKRAVDPS